jgi:hypothetical protein
MPCKDLWARMHSVVANMQERLAVPLDEKGKAGKGGKFHDTLVSNIQDVLDVIPKLNLTNDPTSSRWRRTWQHLVKFPAETLRQSPVVRDETRAKAAAIAKRLAQYV